MPTVEPNRAAFIITILGHLGPLIAGSRHDEDVAKSQTDRMKGNLPAVRRPQGSEVVARIGSQLLRVSALNRDTVDVGIPAPIRIECKPPPIG